MQLKSGLSHEALKCGYGSTEFPTIEENLALSQKEIRLTSAKNDFVAFQVVLKSNEDFVLTTTDNTAFHPLVHLAAVRTSVELSTEHGELVGVACRMHPIGFIEDDDRCMKADLLLHQESILIKRGVTQPIWVELTIPADFRGDSISGCVNVYVHQGFGAEEKVSTLAFSVEVMDVTLPEPVDYKIHLNLWQHPSNIARTHEVHLWSDEHFRVLENYTKSLAELGQKVVTVVVSEVPWAGQKCFRVTNHLSNLFEYSMVRITKTESGDLSLDFTALDRYIEQCFLHGINREIEVIGLVNIWCDSEMGFTKIAPDYPDAIRLRYYDAAMGTYAYLQTAREIEEYIRKLEQHFISQGWIEKVRVMADEPGNEEEYAKSLQRVREIAPHFQFKAAINHTSFIRRFANDLIEFAPVLHNLFEGEWQEYDRVRREGSGRYLWYVCCGQRPDSCLRAPLLESRFISWLTAYLELDGFLRWNYTVWPENPRENIHWNYPLFPAGENNFVYPNHDGRPILSLRYKHLQRGIQDFELISLVRERCPNHKEILSAIFERVIHCKDITKVNLDGPEGLSAFSRTYSDYVDAKKLLLQAILASIS